MNSKNRKRTDQEQKILDEVLKDICATDLPNMLNILYGIGDAMMIFAYAVDSRIRSAYARHGFKAPHGFAESDLKGLKEYVKAAKAMQYWFDRTIEPHIQCATVNEKEEFDIRMYDNFHADSNWLLRLICYGLDRAVTHDGIVESIRSLEKPSPCLIPDEVIEKFRQR